MSQTPVTRHSLILRLRNRQDAEAWYTFIEIYEPIVFRMMQRSGLQAADAIEQTQEVMTAVAQAINRFEPDNNRGRFRTWLYRVARNILADYWRKTVRSPITGVNSVELEDWEEELESTFDPEYQRQVLIVAARRVKTQVNELTWKAFWQTTIEQRSVETVADELNVSPGNVYVAKSRVMKKLQDAARSFLKSDAQA